MRCDGCEKNGKEQQQCRPSRLEKFFRAFLNFSSTPAQDVRNAILSSAGWFRFKTGKNNR